MSARDNGDLNAFSIPTVAGLPHEQILWGAPGLTKREYIAAMIMSGTAVPLNCGRANKGRAEAYAQAAVEAADALLTALERA